MHPLKFKIRDIPDEGVHVDTALDRRFLAEALDGVDADLDASSARTQLTVTKFGENVFLRGKTVADLAVPCARCLAPAAVHVEIPVRVTFAPEDADAREETLEDDEEFAHHDRQFVDASEVLREGLILAVPMTPLCDADCKGLCPVCGADKNTAPCGCDPHPPDPRLAAAIEKLRGIKL